MKKDNNLLLIILLIAFVVSVVALVLLYKGASSVKGKSISCGGDWSYNVKCPLGTYCKPLNQGPLAGGVCTPLGK